MEYLKLVNLVEQQVRDRLWVILLLFAACLFARVVLVERHSLWADEFFSLAMATGHSLEHPAEAADPGRGDYVEPTSITYVKDYSRYLEHEDPPAGVGQVVHAVKLSDTSPPLYYVFLYYWTLSFGTGDASLRLFSTLCSLICFWVMYRVSREFGHRDTPFAVLLVYAFSPVCVYYSTEGRMYSLLWVFVSLFFYYTLKLRDKPPRAWAMIGWIASGCLGLYTHYFFVFIWGPVAGWMLLRPGGLSRGWIIGGSIAVLASVAPWYIQLPTLLSSWRVTGEWLKLFPYDGYNAWWTNLTLPWNLVTVKGHWGVRPRWDQLYAIALMALSAAFLIRYRKHAGSPLMVLCLVSIGGMWVGLIVFDWMRGTYSAAVLRYMLPALPAACLLIGYMVSHFQFTARVVWLAAILFFCLIGDRRIYLDYTRSGSHYERVARFLVEESEPTDAIIVHSIPSGVAGLARYVEMKGGLPDGAAYISWVGQLGTRAVPDDLLAISQNRERILVVNIHAVWEPEVQVDWLKNHAELVFEKWFWNAHVYIFKPKNTGSSNQDGGWFSSM